MPWMLALRAMARCAWLAAAVVAGCGGGAANAPRTRVAPELPGACAPSVQGSAPWPMDGGLPARTRRSAFVGPSTPTTKWVYELPFPALDFAIDGAATVYATTLGGMTTIDRDGARRWSFRATPFPQAGPVVGANGAINVELSSADYDPYHPFDVGRGALQGIGPCGDTVWAFHAPQANVGSPGVGPDGTIYVVARTGSSDGEEVLHAVRPDGRHVWSRPTAKGDTLTTPPTVGDDGIIYIGSLKGTVDAIGPDGRTAWSTSVSGDLVHALAVGEGGVYAAIVGGVAALDWRGKVRWTARVAGRGVVPPPAIAADGTVYIGGLGALRALSKEGAVAWQLTLPGYVGAPIVARDGTIYVATSDHPDIGRLYAVDPGGTTRWRYYTEPVRALALGGDGLLYAAAGKRLYAITSCAAATCDDDGSTVPAINRPNSGRHDLPPDPPVARPAVPGGMQHQGYAVYEGCHPQTTAIVSDEGDDFPWYRVRGNSVRAVATREEFRGRALGAAGDVHWHASGFGLSCVDPRGAFVIFVLPGQPLDAAARRIGEWLVREHLRGEIDLYVSEVPHLL